MKKYSIIFAILFFLTFSQSVYASTNKETLRVTPAYISITKSSNTNTSENLSILNESLIPLEVSLSQGNIEYINKKLTITQNNAITNINSWIKITQKSFIIQPKATINIPVDINIPKNTKNGSYNGEITISNITKNLSGQSRVEGSIVINVFVNIRGKNKNYSNINSKISYLPLFINTLPLNLDYTLNNPGPYNNAAIININTQSLFYSKNTPTNVINLLVEQTRYKTFQIQNIPWGIYKISFNTNNIGEKINKEKSFYIIYLPYYIYLILGIIIIIIIYLKVRKSKVKYF